MLVPAREAWSRWSTHYDATPNPVTALESRILGPHLEALRGRRFLDAGCGTGRWMAWAASRGLAATGIDRSPEMARIAGAKPGLGGRCVMADLAWQPFTCRAFDLAVCSFALGYVADFEAAVAELARVAHTIVVSDLHPKALCRGWKRGFRTGPDAWEIEHHSYSLETLDECAAANGLRQMWRIEASLGEPEKAIFAQAGRASAFEEMIGFPAIAITAWNRLSV